MARHYGGPVKSAVNASERQARQIEAEDATLSSPLLAGISHELRTPLNAIIGFAEIVYDERMAPLDPVNKEFIQEILNSARHLLHVVNDVLDLSAIQTGHMQFHPEALDVGAIAQEVIENLRPLSEVKGISIDRHIDAVLGTVETDPLRFRQILYNYLSNAIKFTPRGGRIELHARPEGRHFFRIEVHDSGPGIAAEDIARLFQPFQQLANGRRRLTEGTGLGLAVTRQLVEGQGGRVGVRSEPGEGSTFYVVLPSSRP